LFFNFATTNVRLHLINSKLYDKNLHRIRTYLKRTKNKDKRQKINAEGERREEKVACRGCLKSKYSGKKP